MRRQVNFYTKIKRRLEVEHAGQFRTGKFANTNNICLYKKKIPKKLSDYIQDCQTDNLRNEDGSLKTTFPWEDFKPAEVVIDTHDKITEK